MFTKSCLAVCALLTCSVALPAEDATDMYKNYDTAVQVDTDITQGYRVDKLKWSISGPHHSKIPTDVTFKNQRIYQTRLRTQITKENYFAKLMLGYGLVHGAMGGNYTTDAQITFGKNFQITPKMTVSPLAGYNWSKQKFRGIWGNIGSYHNLSRRKLDRSYQATWDAPFIGARAAFAVTNDVNLFAEYDFLFANQYNGKCNWNNWNKKNLYFTQHSSRKNGFGHMGTVGASYKLSTHCSLAGEYQLSYLHAKGGSVKFRRNHHHQKNSFQKASLLSSEIRLAFNYAF